MKTEKQSNYEFRARDVQTSEAITEFVDQAVGDIQSAARRPTDVQVQIASAVRDKGLFTVSMRVIGLGKSIVVTKDGQSVLGALRKVRHVILEQIHALTERRVSSRRRRSGRRMNLQQLGF